MVRSSSVPVSRLRRRASVLGRLVLGAIALGACGGPAGGTTGGTAGSSGGDGRASAPADVRCDADPTPSSPSGAGATPRVGPATVRFTVTTVAPGPVGLAYASAVWTGREHLLFGGATPSDPEPPGTRAPGGHGEWVASPAGAAWTSIGWALDPALGTWRALPGDAPPGSTGTDAVTWHCGRAFILTASGAGYRYDPMTGDVRATAIEGAPTQCSGQRIVTHGASAFVWGCGGCAAHVYDARSDAWETRTPPSDLVDWTATRCDWLPTAVVGDRLVVLRRYRDMAGLVFHIDTRRWSTITDAGSPESVHAGPVSDASALWVVGQTGSVAGIYRYDLSTSTWSHTDLRDGVCNLGSEALYRDGVLVSAGEYSELPAACAYDLTAGTPAGEAPRGASSASTVTNVGDDHVFLWAHVDGTDEGDGEMPRMPTRWIDNAGRIVTYEITR